MRFATTKTGVFSAMLALGGKYHLPQKAGGTGSTGHSLIGRFDVTGRSRHVIPRPPLAPLRVDLRLDPEGYRIVGTVASTDENGVPFTSDFTASPQRADPAFTGYFTMLLEATGTASLGTGYATGHVSATGEARIVGALPDGSRFTSGCFLHAGDIPIHAILYTDGTSARGTLSGTLPRGGGFVPNATGTLRWLKPARPGDAIANGPLDVPMSTRMFRYRVPIGAPNALESTLPPATADFLIGSNVTGKITIDRESRVQVVSANPSRAAFAFDEATGLFTGSFLNPANGRLTGLRGIALQGDERAGGFYLNPEAKSSAPVSILTKP